MGRTEQARQVLSEAIQRAQPGDRVASVASLSEAVGGMSTAATVGVLREAIETGWIRSTRGPHGGYWRTDKPLGERSLDEALAVLADQLEATLVSVREVQQTLRH